MGNSWNIQPEGRRRRLSYKVFTRHPSEFMLEGGLKFASGMKQKDTSLEHWKLQTINVRVSPSDMFNKSTIVFSFDS